eukprot:scaffold207_cov409-Prasinococcus_capsulatus_cf.AAC.32
MCTSAADSSCFETLKAPAVAIGALDCHLVPLATASYFKLANVIHTGPQPRPSIRQTGQPVLESA